MDFEYSPRTKELQAQLLRFMDEHIYPAEQRYEDEIEANTKAGKRWTPLQTIEALKPKARAQGLWNLFLPPTAGGKGSKESGASSVSRTATTRRSPRSWAACRGRPKSSTARRPTPATWRRSSATARPRSRTAGCSRSSTARSGARSR
jgi:alkylation response protein AidB-like acyl-CoA dehydrogenase